MCKTAVYNSSWSPAYKVLLHTIFVTSDPHSHLYCPYQIAFVFPDSDVHQLKPEKNFMCASSLMKNFIKPVEKDLLEEKAGTKGY